MGDVKLVKFLLERLKFAVEDILFFIEVVHDLCYACTTILEGLLGVVALVVRMLLLCRSYKGRVFLSCVD